MKHTHTHAQKNKQNGCNFEHCPHSADKSPCVRCLFTGRCINNRGEVSVTGRQPISNLAATLDLTFNVHSRADAD